MKLLEIQVKAMDCLENGDQFAGSVTLFVTGKTHQEVLGNLTPAIDLAEGTPERDKTIRMSDLGVMGREIAKAMERGVSDYPGSDPYPANTLNSTTGT